MAIKPARSDKKIAALALLLGILAVVGSLAISLNMLKKTAAEIEDQILHFYAIKASTLAALSVTDDTISDAALLAKINDMWRLGGQIEGDEYICVVDSTAHLILHSADSVSVGSFVGENSLVGEKQPGVSTLSDLLSQSEKYAGEYISGGDDHQIAAFSPLPNRGWLIGVHRSKAVIEAEISRSLRPELLGILVVSLFLIPLALALLYYVMYRTKMKNAEIFKELARQQVLLQALMDNSPDHIYFKDLDSRFIKINQAQAKYLNLSGPEQAVGKNDFDFFPKEHAQAAYDNEQQIIKTGKPLIGDEEYHRHNHEDTWISATKVPLADAQCKIFGTVGISRDITERMKARENLQREIERQTVLYEIAKAHGTTRNLEALCQSIYQTLSAILDTGNFYIALRDEQSKGLTFPFYIDRKHEPPGPVPYRKGVTEYVIDKGTSLMARTEDILKMRDRGDVLIFGVPPKIWLGVPLRLKDRCVGAVVVQSYDDESLYNEDHIKLLEFVSTQITTAILAKQAEEKLAGSEQLRELLLDIITHDLRNPIGLMFNFSELAINSQPDNVLINQIHQASIRLLKILENTTILSQAVFGEVIPMQELDLRHLLHEVISEFKVALEKADMSLELDLAEDVHIRANLVITEIFKNYISNGIKYARSGKKLVIKVISEPESVLISVNDFGDTLAPVDRERIFNRHVQLDTEKKQGRGLGLAIVKRIAAAHVAEVWVEPNTARRGNSFCLRIPRLKTGLNES